MGEKTLMDKTVSTLHSQSQYGLSSLLWITTASAVTLAYARSFGSAEMQLVGAYAFFVTLFASLIGGLTGAWSDTWFWSILVTLAALVAVAGYPMQNWEVRYGWGAVGAGCGALCGSRCPTQIVRGSVAAAILGVVLMTLCVLLLRRQTPGLLVQFDIISACIIGGLLRPLVEVIERVRLGSRVPRVVFAAWLILCLIAGKSLFS